jgi:hypothetical protein
LGAVNIKNILKKERLPSGMTSNTTKVRSNMETYETVENQEFQFQKLDKFLTISANSPLHSKNFQSQIFLNKTHTPIDPKLSEMISKRPSNMPT